MNSVLQFVYFLSGHFIYRVKVWAGRLSPEMESALSWSVVTPCQKQWGVLPTQEQRSFYSLEYLCEDRC